MESDNKPIDLLKYLKEKKAGDQTTVAAWSAARILDKVRHNPRELALALDIMTDEEFSRACDFLPEEAESGPEEV